VKVGAETMADVTGELTSDMVIGQVQELQRPTAIQRGRERAVQDVGGDVEVYERGRRSHQ
jgi:hypothetical protein